MRAIGFLLACFALTVAARPTITDLPIGFEENRGQAAPEVKFLARNAAGAILLTAESAVLWLPEAAVELRCAGARAAGVEALDPLPGVTSYLRGQDPARWRTGIGSYARVRYRQVYPGIDLVFHAESGELEYDFVLAPGADPAAIRVRFQGAEALRLDGPDLVLRTASGEIRQRRPVLYQEHNGVRAPLSGEYVLSGNDEVRFRVAPYDPARPLVIDPVLSYQVRLGPRLATPGTPLAGLQRGAAAVAVDAGGNAYLLGSTYTADFPTTPGAFQGGFRSRTPVLFRFLNEVFVAKLNPEGNALVYSTFLGGADDDVGSGLALAPDGSVYVTGYTSSDDFPVTSGAFLTSRHGSPGGFVAKLNPSGSALVYSTYLGGGGATQLRGVAIDAAGSAYVAGVTNAQDFPTTPGAFRTALPSGRFEALVAKLRPDGGGLAYSTFLGPAALDSFSLPGLAPVSIVVAADGSAVVGGQALFGFPVTDGAAQTILNGSVDGFVARLRPDGSGLVYSTYLGGSGFDGVSSVALDAAGNAYVGGYTLSPDFPATPGALRPGPTPDLPVLSPSVYPRFGFLTKFDPAGHIVYSALLGGTGRIVLSSVAVDAAGNAFAAGATDSPDFPTTPEAVQRCIGNEFGYANAFLTKVNAGATAILYSTYLGGNVRDDGAAVALDRSGNAYLTGRSDSTDFGGTAAGVLAAPTGQVFLSKIDFTAPSPSPAVNCVFNLASRTAGALAPGEIVGIYGTGLGPAETVPLRIESGRLTTSLGGTRVLFDGVAAPLILVSANQINAIVPYAVANRTATVMQVEAGGRTLPPRTFPVRQFAPALFTVNGSGAGPGAIVNQDGTLNSPSNPAERGSIVSLFANGLALANTTYIDGEIAPETARPAAGVAAVSFFGVSAPILYAGPSPGLVSALTQINIVVPRNGPTGVNVPVAVTALGNISSPGRVTMAIR